MSGIISDPAFNDMFTATKDDNTMQATVTAVYEVGKSKCGPNNVPLRSSKLIIQCRLSLRCNSRIAIW